MTLSQTNIKQFVFKNSVPTSQETLLTLHCKYHPVNAVYSGHQTKTLNTLWVPNAVFLNVKSCDSHRQHSTRKG